MQSRYLALFTFGLIYSLPVVGQITYGDNTRLSLYKGPGCPTNEVPTSFVPSASIGNCTNISNVYSVEYAQLGLGCNAYMYMKKDCPKDAIVKFVWPNSCNDFNGYPIQSLQFRDCELPLPASPSGQTTTNVLSPTTPTANDPAAASPPQSYTTPVYVAAGGLSGISSFTIDVANSAQSATRTTSTTLSRSSNEALPTSSSTLVPTNNLTTASSSTSTLPTTSSAPESDYALKIGLGLGLGLPGAIGAVVGIFGVYISWRTYQARAQPAQSAPSQSRSGWRFFNLSYLYHTDEQV